MKLIVMRGCAGRQAMSFSDMDWERVNEERGKAAIESRRKLGDEICGDFREKAERLRRAGEDDLAEIWDAAGDEALRIAARPALI